MLILDTDHVSALLRGSAEAVALRTKLAAANSAVNVSIVTVEEVLRGQLAQIAGSKTSERLIVTYARAQRAFAELATMPLTAWDAGAAAVYDRLRSLRLGIGTMDLRIASIALANDAKLLSRNLGDFERVPELKVEDWLS